MISVILPAYNEQENIEMLHERLEKTVSKMAGYQFEFIFVDDSSRDKTPEILKRLHEKDKRVKTIRLARNCGSHVAIAVGLNECKGDCAIVLAADLQDPPELISRLLEQWKAGAKIVWGARKRREGEGIFRQVTSKLYYVLMNWLTAVQMPSLGTDVFLADRVAINAFKQVTEKHTSIFMTLAWMGFQQSTIEYVKEARFAGKSKWTLGKKVKLTIDSILTFSDLGIRYISISGFLTACAGFIYAIITLNNYLHGSPVQGWTSLMIAILVIGGIQMLMLGILGEYLWRTYDESRRRPRYIIEYKID